MLDFELVCLQLVMAIREADFPLYLKAIRELIPWMFTLDSHNYAKWLSVHYRDMCELSLKHPNVYVEFRNGSLRSTQDEEIVLVNRPRPRPRAS